MAGWDALCVVATDGRASLAGKMYECLALRKPIVVVAPEGPATRLVTELGAGTVGEPHDAGSIRAAILAALGMAGPDFAGSVGRGARPVRPAPAGRALGPAARRAHRAGDQPLGGG